MVPDNQQCVLEFEGDEHGEHHTKEALEDQGICRIEHMASSKPKCGQQQLPGRERYDDSDHKCEYRDDRLLKALIDRQSQPFGAQVFDLGRQRKYFVRHRPSALQLLSSQFGCRLHLSESISWPDLDTRDERRPVLVPLSHSLPKAARSPDSLLSGRLINPTHCRRQPSLCRWGH